MITRYIVLFEVIVLFTHYFVNKSAASWYKKVPGGKDVNLWNRKTAFVWWNNGTLSEIQFVCSYQSINVNRSYGDDFCHCTIRAQPKTKKRTFGSSEFLDLAVNNQRAEKSKHTRIRVTNLAKLQRRWTEQENNAKFGQWPKSFFRAIVRPVGRQPKETSW